MIVQPEPNTAVALGQTLNVVWTAVTGATRYELSFSIDGGTTYSVIGGRDALADCYTWPEVRAASSNAARIRVEAFQDSVSIDQSEAEVVLVPFLAGVVGVDVNTKGTDPVDGHDLKWELDTLNPGVPGNKDTYGNRVWRMNVRLGASFPRPPRVFASMAHFDICQQQNPIFVCEVSNVANDSFALRFRTFAKTVVYGGTATWIAFPMLRQGPFLGDWKLSKVNGNPLPFGDVQGKSIAFLADGNWTGATWTRSASGTSSSVLASGTWLRTDSTVTILDAASHSTTATLGTDSLTHVDGSNTYLFVR